MSNILNYQNGFTFTPAQGMPVDNAIITFKSYPVATLFNHARCFSTAPQIGEVVRLGNPSFGPLSGGGGSSIGGNFNYLSTPLANNLSASSRGTLGGPGWFMGLSGGTIRYDIPWLMSFRFRNLLTTSPLTGAPVQRIYVGSDAGRQILRFERCPAGREAYPPFTRGIGFELSRNPIPLNNNIHRIKMFARDGTSTLSGTYTETPYITAGMILSNTINKVYNIILENTGQGIAKLYFKTWEGLQSLGNRLTTDYLNTINTPYFILSGPGVPKDSGFVSPDWYYIEQATVSEYALSGGAQDGTTGNQFIVDRPLIYFGALSSLYTY